MNRPAPANPTPLTPTELQSRIDALPRVSLAHLPTPLEFCPRLSETLGGPQIYFKRDDLTGLAFGGNKTRQLEFLLAEVIEQGIDTIVAGAYTQSNWCRQITAAACKLNLDVSLILLHGEKGPLVQGNLLLDKLMGADVTVTDLDDMQKLPPLLEARAAELSAAGRRPFVVNPFGLEVLARSTVGYVNAALELHVQLAALSLSADYIYVSGANMTPAGLSVGMRALGQTSRVVGITPIRWDEDRASDIARIATACAGQLQLDLGFSAADISNYDDYIGERYGVVSPAGKEAFTLAAQCEGIILDPVYTSKALAGLIDHIRKGQLDAHDTVVFVHTGGNPAVFAYADDLLDD